MKSVKIFSRSPFSILWWSGTLSSFGDWATLFASVALASYLGANDGNSELTAVVPVVARIIPAFMSSFAGLLADRFSRKSLMLWANLLQVGLALSFLLVDGPEDMWWLVSVSGLMMLLHGVYVTAERAALPNIVDDEDLITANAIDSASWSSALCIGAMLGGIVVSIWGTDMAFIIDSYTFLLSALLLIPQNFTQNIDPKMKGPLFKTAFSNIKIGWSHIYSDKKVLRIVFAKSSWNLAGAGLAGVFLVLAGSELTGYGAAFGFGLFFFARGLGTGIGPLLARALFKDKSKWPSLIGILVTISGFFYLLIGISLDIYLPLTVLLIICAHSASGGNWVLSTVLTQMWVEDEVRGRVFSMDMLILGSSAALSTTIAGYLVEYQGLTLRNGFISFSILMIICGIIFTFWRPDIDSTVKQ